MENKMAIIALENIRKSYADGNQMHHVLNQLNLSVEPNEFVAILGPSGSGKSTLLAIAGLLLSADEGRISIAGQDLTGLKQGQWTQKRLELLGFIFQDHQLLSYMKIGDQLELVAKLKGKRTRKNDKRKSKPCWQILASKLVTTNILIRCPVGKNNGQPLLGPLLEIRRSS